MITNHYTGSLDREATLEQIKGLKIIDIGGANSFAHGFLDAVIDIREPQANSTHKFIGDICDPTLWTAVLSHVKKHGKWDYAICTHTLEDVVNPMYVAAMIGQVAKAGVCVTPSKYREFGRFQGPSRGYMHHFWIFDILDGVYTCWPKHNFIEDAKFDRLSDHLPDNEECVVEWTGEIGLQMINAGMPFGTADMSGERHMEYLYEQLLKVKSHVKKFIVITTSDKTDHPGWGCLQASLDKFGYDYHHILNEFSFGHQLPVIQKWAEGYTGPATHFLYTDCFDTLALSTPTEVISKWDPDYRMLISAEKNCYPHPERAKDYPVTESPWKYVNGGGWIVEIAYFKELCKRERLTNESHDQVWLMEAFLKNQSEIKIDNECQIFQTIAFSNQDEWEWSDRMLNKGTGTYPIFFHGNGHTEMDWIYKLI